MGDATLFIQVEQTKNIDPCIFYFQISDIFFCTSKHWGSYICLFISNFTAQGTNIQVQTDVIILFTPQPLGLSGVLFSPMVSGWAGGRPVGRAGERVAGKSLSGLYLRNRKV